MVNNNQEAMRRDFLDWCEKERRDAIQQLERFESGLLTVGHSGPDGTFDDSPAMMEHLRRIIESMDVLIPKVRADLHHIDD